jgi:predicted unusual protein kinase regulating ubiquinone biosynthesis (AarF/ABC1/UbiB family)
VKTLVSNKYKVFKLYLLERVLNSFQNPLLFLPKIILQEKQEEIRRKKKNKKKAARLTI